jgi:acyl carrier protein
VLCEDNLDLLGIAPKEVLQANFDTLLEQYNEAIGGTDALAKINQVKKIYLLESKILRANALINVLLIHPNENTFNELFKFGYMLPNYKYSDENIINLIQSFEGFVKFDAFELQKMVENFEKENQNNESDKPKREGFIDMIIALCEHFKISINETEISVEKYCGFIKRYQKDVERMIANQQKQK